MVSEDHLLFPNLQLSLWYLEADELPGIALPLHCTFKVSISMLCLEDTEQFTFLSITRIL